MNEENSNRITDEKMSEIHERSVNRRGDIGPKYYIDLRRHISDIERENDKLKKQVKLWEESSSATGLEIGELGKEILGLRNVLEDLQKKNEGLSDENKQTKEFLKYNYSWIEYKKVIEKLEKEIFRLKLDRLERRVVLEGKIKKPKNASSECDSVFQMGERGIIDMPCKTCNSISSCPFDK